MDPNFSKLGFQVLRAHHLFSSVSFTINVDSENCAQNELKLLYVCLCNF